MSARADTIYTGGEIVTVDDAAPSAEAVAVGGGRIVGVGDRETVVRLDANPLTVDPMAIRDIRVVETIKEGRTIYSA